MSKTRLYLLSIILLLALGVQACAGTASPSVQSEPPPEQAAGPGDMPTPPGDLSLANPASVYCEENGGVLEVRTDSQGGEFGVCIFADGSECEEWAFMRGECQPVSDSDAITTPRPARYSNPDYGFSIDPPDDWTIDGYDDHLIMSNGSYRLFVGYSRAGEQAPIFRTGMPSGDFVDGGSFIFMGEERAKRLLEAEGKIKLVDYATRMPAGDLLLSIWFEPDPNDPNLSTDYREWDISIEAIQEAEDVLFTFRLGE